MHLAFSVITYVGGACCAIFMLFCLDWIEENSVSAKHTIKITLGINLLLHFFLLFDQVSHKRVLFSILCHIWYSTMLIDYPNINLTGMFFLGSLTLSIANHFIWFFYFTNTYHSLYELISFFGICIWMVPLLFFISLSANDSTLPVTEETKMTSSPSQESPTTSLPSASTSSMTSGSMRPRLNLSIPKRSESIYDDIPSRSRRQSALRRGENVFKKILNYYLAGDRSLLPIKK